MSEYGSPSRYRDAKPRVDSGYNTRKEDIRWGGRLNSRFRREENFRRVSCKTLVKLLDEDSGVDVLLLDLRDADDFKKNHIANAELYPYATLTRASNNLSPSILQYANKEPSSIVIYDNDERQASLTGAIFFEKGFDNVYVLTGGLSAFAAVNGRYVVGDVAELLRDREARRRGRFAGYGSRSNSVSSSVGSGICDRPGTNESGGSLMSSTNSLLSMRSGYSAGGGGGGVPGDKRKNRRRLGAPMHFTTERWKGA